MKKFPDGKYWNHAGSSKNNPDGYTSTPCTHHGNCSKGGTDYSGWCGCNSFGSSIQCFGFANKLAYDAYGSYYTSWSKTTLNNLKPGDVIRYKNNGHSIFVTGVSGNTITYGDCNSDGHCKIRWGATISKSTVTSTLTAVYSAPSILDAYSETKPTNPTISKSQNWYDLDDTIEIYIHADGATSYYMSMFKDGQLIVGQNVNSGTFSMPASRYGVGDYSVYFSCTNSAGSVDSSWLDFSVVGKPTYSKVYASNWWYDLSDTVSITLEATCYKGQVIGIDKNGVERIITEETDTNYTIPASKLGVGKYSAYFTVFNGSGEVDTERVEFEIVDKPKEGAIVSTSKNSYTLTENVDISVSAYCTKGQVIGIDKEGYGRVITESLTNGKYNINASKLGAGKYSAYFSVYNGSGSYDTERVYFSIDNELKNQSISMPEKRYRIEDTFEVYASADGGVQSYNIIIYDKNQKEVLNEEFTGNKYSANTNILGIGEYTVKVVCKNYAFSVETSTLEFSVYGDLLGDINTDGEITLEDTILVLRHIVSAKDISDEPQDIGEMSLADMNSDGKITVVDVLMLQKMILS